jgi:hypothetical protein
MNVDLHMFVFTTQRGQHMLTKQEADWLAAISHQDWRNHKCASSQQCSTKIACPVMWSCRFKCLNTEFREERNRPVWFLPQSNILREFMISSCIANINRRTLSKNKDCLIRQSWKSIWQLLSLKHFTLYGDCSGKYASGLSNRNDSACDYGNIVRRSIAGCR